MNFTPVLLFLLGATLGTLGDYSHVASGTDGYPTPLLPLPFTQQPFWVPLLFGAACLGIVLTHLKMDFVIGPKNRRLLGVKTSLLACFAFLGLYAASGFLTLQTGGTRD